VFGGGIYNSGTLTVIDSTVLDNVASAHCSTFVEAVSGGGILNRSTGGTWIYNSTISGNSTEVDDSFCTPLAAGVMALGGHLVIHNSTVSGNAEAEGVGIVKFGNPAVAFISHSTITGNSRGGVRVSQSDLYMRNSIIALNSTFDLNGVLTGSGHNLFGNSEGGSGYDDSDILDVDPVLGPLTDNGGPTLTHALLPGSPAIDAGDNTDAPEWDQRGPGFPRIVNGTIDIGAFEVQAPPLRAPNRIDFDALAVVLATADLDALG
jgi:hypothetical protein